MVKVLSILNKLDNAIFVVQKILILIGVFAAGALADWGGDPSGGSHRQAVFH